MVTSKFNKLPYRNKSSGYWAPSEPSQEGKGQEPNEAKKVHEALGKLSNDLWYLGDQMT